MSAENKSFELIKSLLTEQYGAELAPKILSGYFAKRKPSLRINPLKGEREATLSELKSAGIELTPSGWYEDGFVVENASEPDIQALPDISAKSELDAPSCSHETANRHGHS